MARRGQVHRAGHQRDLGAGLLRRAGDGKTHLAAGMVGDAAHRVYGLKRGAGGDQPLLAPQWLRAQQRHHVLEQLGRLQHAAVTRFAAGLLAMAWAEDLRAIGP